MSRPNAEPVLKQWFVYMSGPDLSVLRSFTTRHDMDLESDRVVTWNGGSITRILRAKRATTEAEAIREVERAIGGKLRHCQGCMQYHANAGVFCSASCREEYEDEPEPESDDDGIRECADCGMDYAGGLRHGCRPH